jgi:hypothetical protein
MILHGKTDKETELLSFSVNISRPLLTPSKKMEPSGKNGYVYFVDTR